MSEVDDGAGRYQRHLEAWERIYCLLCGTDIALGLLSSFEDSKRTNPLVQFANNGPEVADHSHVVLGPEIKVPQDVPLAKPFANFLC